MGLGLIDIAKPVETFDLRGDKIEVRALKLGEAAQLVFRFPELRRMMETRKLDVAALIGLSDDLANAVIASGVDALTEEIADNLALDEKLDLMGIVMRLTMPRGPVPFVGALTRFLSGLSGVDPSSADSGTKSSKRRTSSSAPASPKIE